MPKYAQGNPCHNGQEVTQRHGKFGIVIQPSRHQSSRLGAHFSTPLIEKQPSVMIKKEL